MLRIRRTELREQGLDGSLLPHDFREGLRTQEFHNGLCQMDGFQLLELLALLGILRRLGILFLFLDDLAADILDVILMFLLELLVDLLLNAVLDRTARPYVRNAFG